MKSAVEMGSGAILYIARFMTISSGILHLLERGRRQERERVGKYTSRGKGKLFTALNLAPHREDVRSSRGTAPRILNLSTKWRCEPAERSQYSDWPRVR
jgi:hypothetical protein